MPSKKDNDRSHILFETEGGNTDLQLSWRGMAITTSKEGEKNYQWQHMTKFLTPDQARELAHALMRYVDFHESEGSLYRASQRSLAKDWERPEEDKAWEKL